MCVRRTGDDAGVNADGFEHERKFLVADPDLALADAEGVRIAQGYLESAAGLSVRVRLVPARDRFTLTVKGARQGITRREAECAIDRDVADLLYLACGSQVIDKTRATVRADDGLEWVVDVFHGHNDGLVMAEVELPGEDAPAAVPPWCGPEVTDDDRYYNEHLAQHPFTTW